MSERSLSHSMRLILSGLVAALLFAPPLHAQEWYIPKRTEILAGGSATFGTRLQYIADEDGILNSRAASAIFSLRWAPINRLELYVEGPFTYREREQIIGFGYHSFNDEGWGDVFTQANWEVWGRQDRKILLGVDAVFPTGPDPYTRRVGLGGGFHRVAPGLTYLHIVDPVALHFYLGHQWTFPEIFPGTGKVEPGGSLRFRFGGSFALNPRMRLSLYTSGDVSGHTWVNGNKLATTDGDVVRYGGSMSWSVSDRTTIDFGSTFGATASAPDAVITLGINYKLR